jgi:signal transduction histidine kinase
LLAWLCVRGAIPPLAAWDIGTLATGVTLTLTAAVRGRAETAAAADAPRGEVARRGATATPSGDDPRRDATGAPRGDDPPRGATETPRRDDPRRGASGPARGALAAGALGGALALAAALRLAGSGATWPDSLLALVVVASGAVLATARPDVTALVVDLGRLRDAGSLERRLGSALGDPSLELRYRLGGGWLTASGHAVPEPTQTRARAVTAVDEDAALLHHPAALEDPALRIAVIGAVRLAVARLRLAADAARQADELAASRRRLVEAADAQRVAFAAEVRAGPVHELDRASALLADLPELAAELAAARAELSAALEVRLTGSGLAQALSELAARAGALADVDLDGPPIEDALAAPAWYCAAEALTNALKYAGGARISLSARRTATALTVEVCDDGPGGADPRGSGLSGLQARAAAAGGQLELDSPPGAGTRITFTAPATAANLTPT